MVYDGAVPDKLSAGLAKAVEYWQQAISGDAGPPLQATGGAGKCALPAGYAGHETDDLLVVVSMAQMAPVVTVVGGVTIDNTPLAIAYTCANRETGLPYFGRIDFNDDANRYSRWSDNRTYNIARHEIAHLLGFGSSPAWLSHVRGGHFHGPAAVREFGGPVPLADDHWPAVPGLTWDIMSVPGSVVRRVTLAALEDIGHTVDYAHAETHFSD